MIKKRALYRNRIALLLAVLLIFCAFGMDGVSACDTVYAEAESIPTEVFEHPVAGEFFTGSLPAGERQTIRT